jgi:ABC-type multidrug transport system ATPase subunit
VTQSQRGVRAESVTKKYSGVTALDDISFTARAGEAIALWGPNGAGKTTLIKTILGLIDFRGEIWVEDQNVRRNGKAARRNIGYVPQEAVFYDWSVQATMEFYARLKKTDTARIAPLLEKLGLFDHAQKSVTALSGGLKQRLALAIALLADPPVLLFDEPTASLDARARSDYLALIAALRQEDRTIIFASHRLEEVEALADRVLVLEAGKLIGGMTPEELRARLLPQVEMALWIPELQRAAALGFLQGAGLDAHFNGRGTVVVRVPNEQKIDSLRLLSAQGITVTNFEIEHGRG